MKSVTIITVALVLIFYLTRAAILQNSADMIRANSRALAEPWRDQDWEGTKLTTSTPVPKPVLAAFENDPPASMNRKTTFGMFLPTNRRYRAKAWCGTIENVVPIAKGWEATVNIRVKLPGTAFCPGETVERWQISKSGEARCVSCKQSKLGGIFVD